MERKRFSCNVQNAHAADHWHAVMVSIIVEQLAEIVAIANNGDAKNATGKILKEYQYVIYV